MTRIENKTIGFFSLIFLISLFSQTFGQYTLNYGLPAPQEQSTLPQSLVEFQKPVLKKKVKPETKLQKHVDGSYSIIGGWEISEASKLNSAGEIVSTMKIIKKDWYNATVPGTVLTTLVEQGVFPNPYFGLNNLAIPDTLCRQEWWYRAEFQIPAKEKDR
ncbi:MAG: glycoside hydrolase family 2, partial [Ignavibacteria bacterium]|nr:glycoside hydrolase family 2 [Ignavibacteria bacterium]